MELPINILTKLYKIQAKSGSEAKMIQYLEGLLPLLGDNITIKNIKNNLYVTKGTSDSYPCIVAHTDQVQDACKNVSILRVEDLFVGFDFVQKKQVGLGADDKNGILMVIMALIKFPVLKACLFHGEETGCLGSTTCELDFFNDCRFILQCDRRGSSDFISNGASIDLCTEEFIKDCELDKFGYEEVKGSMTDVVTLKQRGVSVACCNISCGYYNPHTDHESTKISDLTKCWNFVQHILSLTQIYHHEYKPVIIKRLSSLTKPTTSIVRSEKLQKAYATRIITKNPNLSESDIVSLWLEKRHGFQSISLVQFKKMYNEKNNR